MEGEFDRDCEEQGGCPPGLMMTVREQWEKIRTQLISGIPKNKQEEEMKEYDKTWTDLQESGQVPQDHVRKKNKINK